MTSDDPAERPHGISAKLIAACDALRGFASAYLDVAADDVSPAERERLARAADFVEKALAELR